MKSTDPSATLLQLCNQAVRLHQDGALAEAERLYLQILDSDPYHVVARHLLGALRHQCGRNVEALELIDAALALQPDYTEALANRGTVLKVLGRLEEALTAYDKALALGAGSIAWNGRGTVLLDMNRFEEALESFDKALSLAPDFAVAMGNRGRVLEYLGRLEAARADYRQALALNPKLTNVYLDYVDLTKIDANDPTLKIMTAMREDDANLSDNDKIHLDFALAKVSADLKDYKNGFQHLMRGNALKRAQSSYDEAGVLQFFDRVEAIMTTDLLRQKAALSGGDPSSAPIFILGMMRSGSTLVEQILASHPQVYGAGELPLLSEIVNAISARDGSIVPYPEYVPDMDAQAIGDIAARYLGGLRKLTTDVHHVTDKMPSNFFMVGLIHLALPHARIIHTLRDPIDTCVSCYSKLFTADQPHTYDLREIGRYYRRYAKLMAHWHRVLPAGRILDVHYEDVVGDLEGQARRILAHCGLEWDPQCLSFHDNERPVRTASVSQVRQKLYGDAMGRAQTYDAFLGPLREALNTPI